MDLPKRLDLIVYGQAVYLLQKDQMAGPSLEAEPRFQCADAQARLPVEIGQACPLARIVYRELDEALQDHSRVQRACAGVFTAEEKVDKPLRCRFVRMKQGVQRERIGAVRIEMQQPLRLWILISLL